MTTSHTPGNHEDAPRDARAFWEERYSTVPQAWSGKVNASFAGAVEGLAPGSALELACGEGADALWLAARGWTVHGVDISRTATDRAAAAAADAGLADRTRFEVADLVEWQPQDAYDLVAASFLHSPVAFPRAEVLRKAAGAVRSGGRLVLVSHAEPPPWAREEHKPHHASMLRAAEELAGLELNEDWEVERAEDVTRIGRHPDGGEAELLDAVIVARRLR